MRAQRGFAVLTVLVLTMLLMGVLTAAVTTMQHGDTLPAPIQVFAQGRALGAQLQQIRFQIVACAELRGDNGTGVRVAFPVTPASGLLRDAVCPATGRNLWTGNVGGAVALQPPLPGFAEWAYAMNATNVRVQARATTALAIAALAELPKLEANAISIGSFAKPGDTADIAIFK